MEMRMTVLLREVVFLDICCWISYSPIIFKFISVSKTRASDYKSLLHVKSGLEFAFELAKSIQEHHECEACQIFTTTQEDHIPEIKVPSPAFIYFVDKMNSCFTTKLNEARAFIRLGVSKSLSDYFRMEISSCNMFCSNLNVKWLANFFDCNYIFLKSINTSNRSSPCH